MTQYHKHPSDPNDPCCAGCAALNDRYLCVRLLELGCVLENVVWKEVSDADVQQQQ